MKVIRVIQAVSLYLVGFAIGLLLTPVTFIINLIKVIRHA